MMIFKKKYLQPKSDLTGNMKSLVCVKINAVHKLKEKVP